jgi:hypothetical protein
VEQDTALLVAMAEIAGVFVGFGALISVTRRIEIEAEQLGRIRAVVTIGLVVIVAALTPVGLARYGVEDHQLWGVSSLVFLLLMWTVIVLSIRKRENRQLLRARNHASVWTAVFFWLFLEVPMQIPLILAVVGIYPSLAPAFYATAIVLNLFQAAFVLAQFVYAQANLSNA